jgi:eukaryotic-like serine/threonine-protein kinase
LLKEGSIAPTDWSSDGRFILFNPFAELKRPDVWALPLFGDRSPYSLLKSEFEVRQAQLSPDGRWLAYVSNESSSNEIYVQPFTADGTPYE